MSAPYSQTGVCRHPLATRPLLYTDSIKGEQVCRDDMWVVTTEELNALLCGPAEQAPTHVEDVYLCVRIAAEGSDWKRDQGETLAHWAQRKLLASSEAGVPVDTSLSRVSSDGSAFYKRPEAGKDDALTPLERYGLECLDAHREDIGDLDGGFLQDRAEACGLLYYVDVTEPCGEYCRCAEYDGFPQQCLRLKPEFEPKMAAMRALSYATEDSSRG